MLPPFVLEILDRLRGRGFAAFAVGGCVRDLLLGREPEDWDVATAATPGEVESLFEKTVPTGVRYGTVTVFLKGGKAEVTTFRADGAYRDGRRPESVSFRGDLGSDLARRDFTMNALAMAPDGAITDLFGGREDIRNGLIRCVGEPEKRFSEDALRMLRAVRFSAQLGFAIETETLRAIERLAPRAALLSPERVRDELHKTMRSPRPEAAERLVTLGLLDGFLEKRVPPEETALIRLKSVPEDARLPVFALLLERRGAVPDAADLLVRLRLDGKTAEETRRARRLSAGGFPEDAVGLKKALSRNGTDAVRLAAYAAYAQGADHATAALDAVLSSGECWSLSRLAVNGGDLKSAGVTDGQEIGRTLSALLRRVIEHPEENDRETLLKQVRTV